MIIPDQDFRGGTSNLLCVNGKLYRGAVLVKPSMVGGSARLSAVNVLDLEDYLMSVLPSEMPSSWPLEAQKAQAIAARSYAMANLGKNGSRGFDVVPTIADQVYTGITRETDSSSRAVRETAGIIMKHGGRPVSAFFHSTSAGMTEVAEHVWVKGVPYLRSVPDFDVKSKYNNWQRRFDLATVEKVYGSAVGPILGMFIVSRSPSQRVKSLMVVGQNGSTLALGKDIRLAFKLPSTNFNVVSEDGAYVFKGQGFGHGLGMSQYGARALAEHGYNAAQILKHYYKDVTFDYVVETKTL
jgi:SpoIID/LytB domain